MPTKRQPRSGSLQYWPRKKASREYARVRAWPQVKDNKPLGFAGYKAGMTHVMAIDNRKNSMTKGELIRIPTTIIECPPLKVASIRFYKKNSKGLLLAKEIFGKADKELGRKITLSKKESKKEVSIEDYDIVRVGVYTQPKLTGIGKKKPELFELAIGGSLEEQYNWAKENLSKEISVSDVFGDGEPTDIKSVTKGKGHQGPVKRMGIGLRSHKSEKSRRRGVIGAERVSKTLYTVPQGGQTGYHTRTEYNKQLLKIAGKDEINPKGGFIRYGLARNDCVLIRGSVGGPTKRLIRFNKALRPTKKTLNEPVSIEQISLESKQ
ncbi:50S ribosomal protein L3 [Candidatus Woesearchaeota archaeon]|nr:50S ribosomal protein L3 [Candidatus Woesearchaeota archaeon]